MLSSMMLFISAPDVTIILVVALVLFGGKKLPELARGLGQGIREFKDASEGVKKDIQEQINKETEKNNNVTPVQNTTVTPDAHVSVTPEVHVSETANHPRETPL